MRHLVIAALLLANGTAVAATVYKWVDANGVTHYSDQPFPGAKKIEVESAQTYAAPAPPQASVPAAAPQAAGPPYKTCELFRPSADEVLFNVSTVTAKLRLDPGLRAGDKATVVLDGRTLPEVPLSGTDFNLTSVYRGTHTVGAVVQNLAGEIVCQTSPVTFHVRQASILSPQSPQAKPPPKPAAKPPAKPPGKS
jgi:hypothetical protein